MKTLSSLFTLLLLFLNGISQCEVFTSLTQTSGSTCVGETMGFFGYATTSGCMMPFTVNYSWSATVQDGSGNTYIDDAAAQSGTAPGITSIPFYTYSGSDILVSVCLTIALYDADNVLLGGSEQCLDNIEYPSPIEPVISVMNNSCGQPNCILVQVNGGQAPYFYELSNGETLSGNGYLCLEEIGVYTVTAIDANGCMGSGEVVISGSGEINSSCSNATLLEDGVIIQDTLCTVVSFTTSCGNANYYQGGWYVFNSGSASHANIGLSSGYYTTPGTIYNQANVVEVYQEVVGQDCEQAELVFCGTNLHCFDLADEIVIAPNTNYYIRFLTQWTTWVPAQIVVELGEETLSGMCGCTNDLSCNYDPDAIIDDGSCGYNGCMDPGACNYASWATCDDGSCIFGNDLTGVVFHDLDADGVRDTWPVLESALGNAGFLTIDELGVIIYPDNEGQFLLPEIESGVYHVTFTDPDGIWVLNNASSSLEITLPTCTGLAVALVPESGAAAQISGTNGSWNPNLHCTNGMNTGIWIQNTGTTTLFGSVTIAADPSLSISTYSGALPFDSNVDGLITWNLDGLAPGSITYFTVHVAGPGVSYVGDVFSFSTSVSLSDSEGVIFYENDWSTNALVTCAYDPNDKQPQPIGMSDEHFILAGQEIEYTIRFQNTGNAPAFNVYIDDSLDLTRFDLSTFTPVVASHSYSTIVQPDGLVRFVFDNIMLPDSVNDEPGSHGYVVYKIQTLPDLQPYDLIENTAYIYFDENPAIVTNTPFHKVFSCDLIQVFSIEDEECAGLSYVYDAYSPFVTEYSWTLDGEAYSQDQYFIYSSDVPGDHEIALVMSNELCTVNADILLHNRPVPSTEVEVSGATMTAPAGSQWSWYLNGEPIEGANTQTYTAEVSGNYNVNTVNEYFCVITSETITIVGLEESQDALFRLYPNPVADFMNLRLPAGNFTIRVLDETGKLHLARSAVRSGESLDLRAFSSGIYVLELISAEGDLKHMRFVVSKH